MSRVVGIDPGMTGALAMFADGQLVGLAEMPVDDGRVDGNALAERLVDFNPHLVCIEDVHAMPRNGSIGSFKLGYNFGVTVGVIHASQLALIRVSPQRWKRTYNLFGKDKGASRGLAKELYPAHAAEFRRARDDGKADAVLIGRWAIGDHIKRSNEERP